MLGWNIKQRKTLIRTWIQSRRSDWARLWSHTDKCNLYESFLMAVAWNTMANNWFSFNQQNRLRSSLICDIVVVVSLTAAVDTKKANFFYLFESKTKDNGILRQGTARRQMVLVTIRIMIQIFKLGEFQTICLKRIVFVDTGYVERQNGCFIKLWQSLDCPWSVNYGRELRKYSNQKWRSWRELKDVWEIKPDHI